MQSFAGMLGCFGTKGFNQTFRKAPFSKSNDVPLFQNILQESRVFEALVEGVFYSWFYP